MRKSRIEIIKKGTLLVLLYAKENAYNIINFITMVESLNNNFTPEEPLFAILFVKLTGLAAVFY